MSTRTNIVLKTGKSVTYLYRHCDGYPAETGADILAKISAALGTPPEHRYNCIGAAGNFLRSVLTATYEQQSYEQKPRSIYELTDNLHGDIEHVYFVTFEENFNTGYVSIKHAERPKNWSENDDEVQDWTRKAKRYSLANFRELVNADRAAINKRIAEMKAKQPQAYADVTDYPLI